MSSSRFFLAALGLPGFALLGACDVRTASNQSNAPASNVDTAATGTVAREPVTREEVPPPPPAQAAIQTQPGPDGATVSLNKVAVTGDILTVQLTYGPIKCCKSQTLHLGEVSVVDDSTAQRIGVLKDNSGKYLAAPLSSDGEDVSFMLDTSPKIVWFKFPAPPATSRTVSVNVPAAGTFDGVPVTR